MKPSLSIGIFLLVTLLLSGCQQDSTSTPEQAGLAPEVSYIRVSASEYRFDTLMQGRVVASMMAEVRPQVSGIIKQRLFTEGDTVEEGQILYLIDPAPYEAAYNEAKADLSSARAVLQAAEVKHKRYANLVKVDGVSRQDADDARADYLEALADIEKYQAALETARINLEYTKVRAPISGHIGISSVTQGALVTAEQDTALATIRALDPVYVDMTKSSKELLKLRKLLKESGIKEGTASVSLILEDGSTYEHNGELKMQEIAVDASTGTVTLRAEFPNPDSLLLPGMFVRTRVNEAVDENAILVPQQGVYQSGSGEMYAYVITADNTIEKRDLEVAEASGNKWLIASGLSVGDRLLVEGSGKVRPGSEVRPVAVTIDENGVVTELPNQVTDTPSVQGGA